LIFMRILFIDIDSLRPDHLGCYGYNRLTSPAIDSIAARGVCFNACYASDVPCLPSRTALLSGRFGYHTGAINHGGVASQPFIEGSERGFRDLFGTTSLPAILQTAGYHTAAVSSFPARHSAWHWTAGFNELFDTGSGGQESAHQVSPIATDWLRKNANRENWFLYVNLWDPHTPYRVPMDYGEPFANTPIPEWLTEDVRQKHWQSAGPHGAQEIDGWNGTTPSYLAGRTFPRQPWQAASMDDVRRMFDGYDTGVRYADDHVGHLLAELEKAGVLEDTAIIITADHGENLGELGIYGDHQTADHMTCRVPLIVTWPGVTDTQGGRTDNALIYSIDWMATLMQLAGAQVPEIWDGHSFSEQFRSGETWGRNNLVVSQAAWTCQRGIRWGNYFCVHTYHDGYHLFPEDMIFDLACDPFEQNDLSSSRPDLVATAHHYLNEWLEAAQCTALHPIDPMTTVIKEGGSFHVRGELPIYLNRLRNTGRQSLADSLAKKYGQ
jgi:arylsulfatase A-like enzyme